jgi:hypothetical protein
MIFSNVHDILFKTKLSSSGRFFLKIVISFVVFNIPSENLTAMDGDAPFSDDLLYYSNNPLHYTNLSTPEGLLEAYQKVNTDDNNYQKAISEISKLEALFSFDPHILDANNDTIPDFSSLAPSFLRSILSLYPDLPEKHAEAVSRTISFIGNILPLYSDLLEERTLAVFRAINEPLISILGTIAKLSITRSKSRFLKPLQCLREPSLINNPLVSVALQDIFAQPSSLTAIKTCLEELYHKETVSEENLQNLNTARRLAGYFYDLEIIKFLNKTSHNILSSIDLSSSEGKFSFLRVLQLQGELFLMLHPTAFNFDIRLPNCDLLKDVRHGLSHITQRKLGKILTDEALLKNVLFDLNQLHNILQNLSSAYPTFNHQDYSSVIACWQDIKTISGELLPRDPSIMWNGLEGLKQKLGQKGMAFVPSLSSVSFENEVDFLLPLPQPSPLLLSYLQLKKDIWDSLANIKNKEETQQRLAVSFSSMDCNRADELRSEYQQKVLILSEIYQQQLGILRLKQREIKKQQVSILDEFAKTCESTRQELQLASSKLQSKKIDSWLRSATDGNNFVDKISNAVGKRNNQSQQNELISLYSTFYDHYKDLQ